MKRIIHLRFTPLLLALFLASPAPAQMTMCEEAPPEPQQTPAASSAVSVRPAEAQEGRVAEEKTGSFPVREGQRLRLNTDVGNIRVRITQEPRVAYTVHVETANRGAEAHKLLKQFVLVARPMPEGIQISGSVPWKEFRGRLWVRFEVSVPRAFQLDLATQGGHIETESINGRVSLVSGGGNVTAGEVGGPARLETKGGHVTVQDVAGELIAVSEGGNISVGNVEGGATVRTAGGHVRVGHVKGVATLESGGGDIFLQKPGTYVTANTLGGRIDFGEAAGGIRARTAGGNIGVLKVSGPSELESNGSICLTQVQGSIKASTASGPITAFLSPAGGERKLRGASQLVSGQGDIVVFVPRDLPVTIEAVIEAPAEHRIVADEGFGLRIAPVTVTSTSRVVRAEAALNGGGEMVRLRTVNGNIRLHWAAGTAPIFSTQRAELAAGPFDSVKYRIEMQQKTLEKMLRRHQEIFEREVERLVDEEAAKWDVAKGRARSEIWVDKVREAISGRVYVSPTEMKDKVVVAPRPVYPVPARQQGIEGRVRVELVVKPGGEVESVRVLSGPPALRQATQDAVRKWRYAPMVYNGKPVSVVTTLDFEFKLK